MLKETLNFKMRQCILQIHGIYLTHSRKSQTGRSFKGGKLSINLQTPN